MGCGRSVGTTEEWAAVQLLMNTLRKRGVEKVLKGRMLRRRGNERSFDDGVNQGRS
jgi:hypothetical protein